VGELYLLPGKGLATER